MKYKAFISYRHMEPDMTAAKKLHTLIETYRIPKSVRIRKNITEVGKVFRDQEELPTSTNLSDDITDALKNSEWLIVICTPNLLKSRWCMQEIDTFIQLGKRDHILAVLVSGTPEESFPEQLKYIERNGERIAVEPLAANIAAPTTTESIRKLKTEKLRLIAPMLGVSFDDLKQRERERVIRRRLAAASWVIAGLLAFSAYAVIQNNRIQKEREAALISQSEYLADASERALQSGDRMLALMLGLEALPANFEKPEKPIVESAVEALRSAVISGVGSDSYVKVTDITYDSVDSVAYSDSEAIYVFGDNKPYVQSFDLHTGKETSDTLKYGFEDHPGSVFMDERMLPIMISGTSASSISSSFGITDMEVPQEIEWISGVSFNAASDNRAFYGKNQIYLWNAWNGNTVVSLPENCTVQTMTPDMYAGVSIIKGDETVYLLKSGYADDPNRCIAMTCRIPFEALGMKPDSIFHCSGLDVTKDHRLIAYLGGSGQFRASHLILWNGENGSYVGNLAARDYLGNADNAYFTSAEFSPNANDYRLAITAGNGKCMVYDCLSEKAVWLESGAYSIQSAHFNSDGSKLLCSDHNNGLIFDAATGALLSVLPAGFEIRDAVFADTNVYGDSVYDMAVLLKGRQGLTIYKIGIDDGNSVFPAAVVLELRYGTIRTDSCCFSKDRKLLFVPTGAELYVLDAETGTQIAAMEDSCRKVICAPDGSLYAFNSSAEEEDTAIRIYDSDSLERIGSICPKYEHTSDPNNRFSYISEAFSSDSRVLLLTSKEYNGTGTTRICKTGVYAFDTETFRELWRAEIDDGMDPSRRIFAEANDWEGTITITAFLSGENVTLLYRYGSYGLVAEVRNIKTGELLSRYALANARTTVTVLNSKTIHDTVEMVAPEFGQLAYYLKSGEGEKYERTLYLADLKDGTLIKSVDLDECCAVRWLSRDILCLFPKYEKSEYVSIWNAAEDTLTKTPYDAVKDLFEETAWPRIQSLGSNHYALIKDASPRQIAEAAKALLNGRELNAYQRKAYHIEKGVSLKTWT